MAGGVSLFEIGSYLGQVINENREIRERLARVEDILMERGAATLGNAPAPTVDPNSDAQLDLGNDFLGLGQQAARFIEKAQQPPTQPAPAAPAAPPK